MAHRAHRRRSARIAIAIAAIGALSLAAAPANAAKKVKGAGKIKTVTSAPATATSGGQLVGTSAVCPKGRKLVGGGFTTTPPLFSGLQTRWLAIYENGAIGPREWSVSGSMVSLAAGTSDTLTAYAYCQRLKAGLTFRERDVTLTTTPAGATGAAVTCPKGTKVLAGGWLMNPANFTDAAFVTRSARSGARSWEVSATRIMGADEILLVTQAHCAKVGKVKERSGTAQVTGPAGSSSSAVSESCPKKTTAKAGGFSTPQLPTGLANAAVVYDTRRTGKTWTTAAISHSDASATSVTSHGYCRR